MPAFTDGLYLVLSDLKLALDAFATVNRIRILDVGCGGSPYRKLFPNATYQRADFVPNEAAPIDYLMDEQSNIPADSAQFDLVLSTQVAEHVPDVHHYFEEMFRVLRPGGLLIVSTHGFFEEHGCPHDYQRWTPAGLRRDLERAGFVVDEIQKLTVGARAWWFIVLWHMNTLKGSNHWAPRYFSAIMRRLAGRLRPWIHRKSDVWHQYLRVVSVGTNPYSAHTLYVCLLASARRPGG